ncbi:Methyltransferase domain-containing protein [Mucilaginibacter sp. OK268]|jgi:2-polyprenyl-3-methyl-5-hydroxy-6-metoxy-1,4-benzoquinol methylase|uniref:class I SAM-dependent methyltransferase n=1 Tax=Mucilaginibacter sp. OK268 TaxID=1881048 RepID=UPI0008888705|nr:class I SAM-dependent methyltransferase [Mucilaginibacter sp. OK268]SDP20132.1 Methyltransferase domain-containing protein [Mucilaginibacter sp. OK268]
MSDSEKQHWENVYGSKAEDDVSWFQTYPKTSMDFVGSLPVDLSANIIDIGGGDSRLVDALLDKGYQNIWVLDISEASIEKAQKRLGTNAAKVHWIVSDVTEFIPPVKYHVWHDRAAFHFLTTEDKIASYVSIAEDAIHPGGYLVLGTFSENGPTKCSGLEIKQYSEASMATRFADSFEKLRCITEDHQTPFNTTQNFTFCSFRRRDGVE